MPTTKRYQHMSDWYQTVLGQLLLDELQESLEPVLATCFGYYALQIGCGSVSESLFKACRTTRYFKVNELDRHTDLYACPLQLPIASDSVDLVVLMHHLSMTSDPHALLSEVSRIIIPQGKLIIIDFNPLSLWGLRYFLQSWLYQIPWCGHYFTAGRLTDWMQLLGFELQTVLKVGYLPPIQKPCVLRHLGWLERIMRHGMTFSSALNVLVYDKHMIPITPIRYRWVPRQVLSDQISV